MVLEGIGQLVYCSQVETVHLTDEALVATYQTASKADRRELLNVLFGRYYQRVALWCYRHTGNREQAADLSQEVFLKVQQNLEGFRGDARFSTWLYTVTRNHCLNALQSRGPKEELGDDCMPEIADTRSGTPEQAATLKNLYGHMTQVLVDTLDETERNVFTLHFAHDMPLEAIGRLLKLDNASGAKAYLVSSKRKLSRALERWKARGGRNRSASEGRVANE